MGIEQLALKGVKCAPELDSVAAKCLDEVAQLIPKGPEKLADAGEGLTAGLKPLSKKLIDAIKDQNVARKLGEREREFFVLKGDCGNVVNALRGGFSGTGKLLVRELPRGGALDEATLGPELKVWVKHFGGSKAGVGINLDMAKEADLIVNCHPELFPTLYQGETLKMLQTKHVFPWARGEINIGQSLTMGSNKVHDLFVVLGSWNNWSRTPLWT